MDRGEKIRIPSESFKNGSSVSTKKKITEQGLHSLYILPIQEYNDTIRNLVAAFLINKCY